MMAIGKTRKQIEYALIVEELDIMLLNAQIRQSNQRLKWTFINFNIPKLRLKETVCSPKFSS